MAQEKGFAPLMGGCGGVYFLVEPGAFWVEVVKRDRNVNDSRTVLRALLVGPNRGVLQEASIADDGLPRGGGLGPAQVARLETKVARRGVYALNVTVSNDRYGENMRWSFRTNCPRYVVETARGHKDERHQEPVVLSSPEQPGDVCFVPRQGALSLEAAGLAAEAGPLQMFDAGDKLLATLAVDDEGKVAHTFPAGEGREAVPWRLHLPSAQGTLNVDGLTRWEASDRHQNVCSWTPDAAAWFPVLENRFLLTPYRRLVYAAAGARGELTLQVRNEAKEAREVALRVAFDGEAWPVEVAPERVTVAPGQSAAVTVRYTASAEGTERVCHVAAEPEGEGFSTYSTVTVKAGEAPALRPLTMPIMLKPYAHENEQFGYLPGYPLDSQLYFEAENRPVTQTRGGVAVLRDGKWANTDLAAAVTSRTPDFAGTAFSLLTTKIAFDADGDMYLLARCSGTNALLHSSDGGKRFAAYAIPGAGGFDLEQFSGHNIPRNPPALVRFVNTARDPKLIWRSVNDLELFVPQKRDGRIEIGAPHLLTRACIGLSAHSGMPSSVVSRGERVHVAWGEATDPAVQVAGVPTYVATYDRGTGEVSKPALIGYGPPANDAHNSPSITMDGDGYLHVLVGTHGRPFQYARSLQPNDAGAGWTPTAIAAEGANQTYIGFVCGKDGTLHVVFRLWRSGEPFPDATHATLAHQRKLPGQPWEAPRVLVTAAFSEYSVFYHRLTIDHAGRLFLSYDYWSTHWFYRNDNPGNRRAVLMSPDGGDAWQLAADRDLQQ